MLSGRLVLTRYNGWLYSFSHLSRSLTIDSLMPPNPKRVAHRQSSLLAAAEATKGGKGGAEVVVPEEETPTTFREYYA